MGIIFMCLFHMNASKLKICRTNGSWIFIWVSHSGNYCLFYSKCILKFVKQLISLKLYCFIVHINSTPFSGVCIALTEYTRSQGEKYNRFMPIIKTPPCLAQEADTFASLMNTD